MCTLTCSSNVDVLWCTVAVVSAGRVVGQSLEDGTRCPLSCVASSDRSWLSSNVSHVWRLSFRFTLLWIACIVGWHMCCYRIPVFLNPVNISVQSLGSRLSLSHTYSAQVSARSIDGAGRPNRHASKAVHRWELLYGLCVDVRLVVVLCLLSASRLFVFVLSFLSAGKAI